ncbi:hypothetical protein IP88_06955 [alpha proteobacterium AAP81b]|nr:hypothetical protein IP88_06955 [alpha proteobacterium AAP81b]
MMSPRLHALLAVAGFAAAVAVAPAHAADARHPTVIELFQSQGCSSCPPAAENVNALAARPDILALSFQVTYWDGLGWKDVYAQPQFTRRQWDYAHAWGNSQVWTPQVVVNGRANITGTRRFPLEALINSTPRPTGPAIDLAGGAVTVAGATARPADVWLVRYDPRTLNVPVRAGENGGRTLPHRNVVKELIKLGRWQGGNARFAIPAAHEAGLATAAFVQVASGGAIIAAVRG